LKPERVKDVSRSVRVACALNIQQFHMLRQATGENWSILNIQWRKIALALSEWPKWNRLFGAGSATLSAMTTQTIPEYLEEERQKTADTQLRTEKEAARIEPLQHGHHRHSTQSKLELELVPPFRSAAKKKTKSKKKTASKKTNASQKTKKRSIAAVARKKPRAAAKKTTNTRKRA
jgi:hypothetical protein